MPRSQAPFSLEYILLGFFYQGPIHGYDLYKKISSFEGISLIWRIKQSQLYALLDKLEKEGLLTSSLVPGEAHLLRKEYQITTPGRGAFLAWVSKPVSHGREMRQEFLAKLFFSRKTGVKASLDLIEAQKAVCAQWLSGLRLNHSKTAADQQYERMIYQYRIFQTQAMIDWLDNCRAEIQGDISKNSESDN